MKEYVTQCIGIALRLMTQEAYIGLGTVHFWTFDIGAGMGTKL